MERRESGKVKRWGIDREKRKRRIKNNNNNIYLDKFNIYKMGGRVQRRGNERRSRNLAIER